MQLLSRIASNKKLPNEGNERETAKTEPARHPNRRTDHHIDLRALVDEVAKSETPSSANPANPANPARQSRVAPLLPAAPKIELPTGDPPAQQLAWLREQVLTCEICQAQLAEHGKIVFGAGSPEADIFFCGDAPGEDEELSGEPFVGKAGQLLTKIISAMGLSRESVYTTNILKWRPRHEKPYGNRPPTQDEMRFCLPYLQAQVDIIQPKVIVALGNTTVTGLLGPDPDRKMGAARGTWANFTGRPVMITFHPSYLLRNDTLKTKRMVWEDMLHVMEKCGLEISSKQRGFFLSKRSDHR